MLGRLAPDGGRAAVHGGRADHHRGRAVLGVALRLYRRGRVRDLAAGRRRPRRFAERLLAEEEVAPAGLGARDSLRLEAGLPLYGNDIDELTSPVEAGLTWTIGKRRRAAWDFLGAAAVRDQLEHHPHRLRVGIRPEGRAPARAGTLIVAEDGTGAGTVTSGGFGPSVNGPVAMGYVRRDLAGRGHAPAARGPRQAASRHRRSAALRPPPLRALKDSFPCPI